MHTKAYKMGITQQMTPFMEYLRAETGKPHQGIAYLTSVDLGETTLEQSQGIQP